MAAETALPVTGAGSPPRLRRAPPWRLLVVPLVLAGLLLGGLVLSLALGAAGLEMGQVWAAIRGEAGPATETIVWSLRMPRAVLACLVGVNLAVSGTLLQAILRNPLAAPDIVGVTAGAGLFATATLVLVPGLPTFLPLTAFAGAMGAAVCVYGISWQPGLGTSPVRMVLAGVAVSVMLGAFTTFLMVAFSDQVQQVVFWMSGNLVDASWAKVRLILPYSVGGLIVAALLVRSLNVLQLGEEMAAGLGTSVERTRLIAMAAACILAASAVSVAGLIGFVGLIVPHLIRMVVGHQHARLLPASAAGGAALMLWADLGARTIVAPTELPVGILTALLGGPYFIFLLYRRKLL